MTVDVRWQRRNGGSHLLVAAIALMCRACVAAASDAVLVPIADHNHAAAKLKAPIIRTESGSDVGIHIDSVGRPKSIVVPKLDGREGGRTFDEGSDGQLLEPEALHRGTKKRHQVASEALHRGTRQRHQVATEELHRGTRHRHQVVTQETTGQTTTNSLAMDDATTTPELVRVIGTQQTTLHPPVITTPQLVDPDGVGTGSYDMNSAGAFITGMTSTSPMVSAKLGPARQATLQKETPATLQTTTTLKPPDCQTFSGVKVCRVMTGFECKTNNTDMGNQASLEDCVTRIKGNGGRYFGYGTGVKSGECFKENTVIDVKQCFLFQDAASCCPEMWKANTVDSWIIMADPSSSEILAPETSGAQAGDEKKDGWFDWMPGMPGWMPEMPWKKVMPS